MEMLMSPGHQQATGIRRHDRGDESVQVTETKLESGDEDGANSSFLSAEWALAVVATAAGVAALAVLALKVSTILYVL